MKLSPADRLVASEVVAWSLAVILLAAGLGWLTGAVETARRGVSVAVFASLLRVPGLLPPLSPLLLGVGAGLAAARMETRRERVALEAAGLSLSRTGLAAAAVGLAIGALVFAASNHLVPAAEARARSLSPPASELAWVWDRGSAVRVADGLRVPASGGRLGPVGWDLHPDPEALAAARMAQAPRTASGAVLAELSYAPAEVERSSRRARIFACAFLAYFGWASWSRSAARQLGMVFTLGLAWQLLDLALQALASQGHVAPWAGAWVATGGLGLLFALGRLRERGALRRPAG